MGGVTPAPEPEPPATSPTSPEHPTGPKRSTGPTSPSEQSTRSARSGKTYAAPAPRLIATDLDGTLLRDDKTVSRRTTQALAAAEAAGIEVFFVTGRPARWMGVVAGHLAGHGTAILANGAAVHDLRAGELIEAFPLPESDALAIAYALREAVPGTAFAVERPHGFRREPTYEPMEPDGPLRPGPVTELLAPDPAQPVLKLLAKHPTADPDDFMATALSVAGRHGEITRSTSSALLEISGAGVTKATTLAKCCAERGLTAAEVVAFGDMPNDLAMLEWAGTSYAVANAHPSVLAATTCRTASNEDDGVARVIERLVAARLR
jgi:Cof subfamily protein (haloacid dehalogenase superfamily)